MTQRMRLAFVLSLLLAIALSAARDASAGAVVISNRGERRQVKGPEAETIVKLVEVALAIAQKDGFLTGGDATAEMEYLRDHEVVLEVKFDKKRELPWGKHLQPMEYAFIPLTTMAGRDGDVATIYGGTVIDTTGVPQLINGPDRFGVIYLFAAIAPHALSPLRAAVAQLGIDVPKPTPYPTPDGTPKIYEMPTPEETPTE